MKNIKNIVIACMLLFVLGGMKAQDYHLAQYDVATMYLNPALTGMYGKDKGDYRVYFDQRSQWKKLGIKPFLTSYIGYDMPLQKKSTVYGSEDNKNFGVGMYIIHNRAGLGNFNTTNIILSGAYDILNYKAKGKHLFTTGLQLGMFYRAFDQSNLSYDNQYTLETDGFDQSIASGETYTRFSLLRFDSNFGLYYKYLEKGKKAHPYAGLSLMHVNMPNESNIGGKSKMPIRFVFNGGCDIQVHEKVEITPRLLYMNQAKANEFNIGLLAYYQITDNETKVMAGFDYRHKDAAIIHLGFKQESYILRMSYDINTSYLKTYSRGRGAFEISLIYTGQKGKSFLKSVSSY